MKAIIKIIQGEKELSQYIISDEINEAIIGRDATCNIIINHQSVSRKHAKLKKDWNGISIYDLSSKNGTYVNNIRIKDHQLLKNGDIIRLGQSKIMNPILLIFQIPPLKIESIQPKESMPPKIAHPEKKEIPFYFKFPYLAIFSLISFIILISYIFFFSSFLKKPEIISVTPSVISYKDELLIKGLNLNGNKEKPIVLIGNKKAEILFYSPEALKVKIPIFPNLEAGINKLPIKVKIGIKTSNVLSIKLKILPEINSLSHYYVYPEDKITIFGKNFSTHKKNLKIWLNDDLIEPIKAKLNSIDIKIPYKELQEKIKADLIVEVNGFKSNKVSIDLLPFKNNIELLTAQIEKEIKDNREIYIIKNALALIIIISNKGNFSDIKERAKNVLQSLNKYFRLAKENNTVNFLVDKEKDLFVIKAKAYTNNKNSMEENIIDINNEDAKFYSTYLNKELNNLEIAYWITYALNDITNIFIFNKYPFYTSKISSGGKVLLKIWELFFKNKKPYTTEKDFMDFLSEKEKSDLYSLFLEFPKEKLNLTGNWIGKGKDIFLKASASYSKLDITIKEENNQITGIIAIIIEGKISEKNYFFHKIGTYNFKSTIKNEKLKAFEFIIKDRKYGEIYFYCKLEGNKLVGFYILSKENLKSDWEAEYKP